MAYTLEIPSEYGYVVLGCGVLPMMMNMYMGGKVMNARKEYNVPYPNCYGTFDDGIKKFSFSSLFSSFFSTDFNESLFFFSRLFLFNCVCVCLATPGYHKKADEFNRVQRGHMNYSENLLGYTVMSFVGGFKHPIIIAVGGVLYSFGSLLYLTGYSDTSIDVTNARYKKGGAIKWIGFFASFYSSVSMAGTIIGWW
mmetsp:Transcript_14753/g.20888  ORF Transcript_14753/g.20888 Transcript_14753/m.20888 type:complete len:196 (+) Transcript_14753:65-652(+)